MTDEEQKLLRRLAAGELEGLVGNVLTTDGGSSVWSCIEDGIPIQYKQGPGSKYFNGKENEHVPGALRKRKTWSFYKNLGGLSRTMKCKRIVQSISLEAQSRQSEAVIQSTK